MTAICTTPTKTNAMESLVASMLGFCSQLSRIYMVVRSYHGLVLKPPPSGITINMDRPLSENPQYGQTIGTSEEPISDNAYFSNSYRPQDLSSTWKMAGQFNFQDLLMVCLCVQNLWSAISIHNTLSPTPSESTAFLASNSPTQDQIVEVLVHLSRDAKRHRTSISLSGELHAAFPIAQHNAPRIWSESFVRMQAASQLDLVISARRLAQGDMIMRTCG
jgi:hypothetical protein